MIIISDFGDALMTLGLKIRVMLLKIYAFDDRFNNIRADRNVSVFHQIRNIYDF